MPLRAGHRRFLHPALFHSWQPLMRSPHGALPHDVRRPRQPMLTIGNTISPRAATQTPMCRQTRHLCHVADSQRTHCPNQHPRTAWLRRTHARNHRDREGKGLTHRSLRPQPNNRLKKAKSSPAAKVKKACGPLEVGMSNGDRPTACRAPLLTSVGRAHHPISFGGSKAGPVAPWRTGSETPSRPVHPHFSPGAPRQVCHSERSPPSRRTKSKG